MWLIAITFLSVGYGDIVPNTRLAILPSRDIIALMNIHVATVILYPTRTVVEPLLSAQASSYVSLYLSFCVCLSSSLSDCY